MRYTVQQLADLSGVSVRTLHYYDELGLLKPASVGDNGYRYYEEAQVVRLQQILFFRELAFSLNQIKNMMDAPGFDIVRAFEDQKHLLMARKVQYEKLIESIDRTIITLKEGKAMNNDHFSAFQDPTYLKHKDEVEQRWGNTDAYKQSMERVGRMSKDELEVVKQEGVSIRETVGTLMKEGKAFDSEEVQAQIERFYQHLHRFYDPSYEMFKGLGEMYVSDARFTKTYEEIAEGLAAFTRDAMVYYAERRMK